MQHLLSLEWLLLIFPLLLFVLLKHAADTLDVLRTRRWPQSIFVLSVCVCVVVSVCDWYQQPVSANTASKQHPLEPNSNCSIHANGIRVQRAIVVVCVCVCVFGVPAACFG